MYRPTLTRTWCDSSSRAHARAEVSDTPTYDIILQRMTTTSKLNCNTLQHTATHCKGVHHSPVHAHAHMRTVKTHGKHTATHLNALQHVAMHCNTFQNTLQKSVLLCGARARVRCSTAHAHAHVHTMQRTAIYGNGAHCSPAHAHAHMRTFQTHCNSL